MLELLKKIGFHATVASVVVILITAVPIFYQYHFTKQQNAKIAALEQAVLQLQGGNKPAIDIK
jgi:hypothetical protein